MNTELLARLIEADAALTGFSPDSLPEAAKLRTLNTLVSLERKFSEEEVTQLENWAKSSGGFEGAEAAFSPSDRTPDSSTYYVCADGSLYYACSGDSEVWCFASDFADERIINGYEGPLAEMDVKLLTHLGGFRAEVVEERGTR